MKKKKISKKRYRDSIIFVFLILSLIGNCLLSYWWYRDNEWKQEQLLLNSNRYYERLEYCWSKVNEERETSIRIIEELDEEKGRVSYYQIALNECNLKVDEILKEYNCIKRLIVEHQPESE